MNLHVARTRDRASGVQRQLTPIARRRASWGGYKACSSAAVISREANVILVNPSVPAKTVPEFVAYAKANAGKINYASPGNGTAGHVSGELFKMMAGVNMVQWEE